MDNTLDLEMEFAPVYTELYDEDFYKWENYLIELESDIFIPSPLVQAVILQNELSIHNIIKGGHPVDYKDYSGGTALHWASSYNNENIAKILLYYGADINSQSKSGRTPLSYAVSKCNIKLVKFFIENNADPYISSDYSTPFIELIILLCDNFPYKKIFYEYQTIYYYFLETNIVDINYQPPNKKYTALHVAVKYGIIDIVNSLIFYGADLYRQNYKGHDILCTSILECCNIDCIQKILELYEKDKINSKTVECLRYWFEEIPDTETLYQLPDYVEKIYEKESVYTTGKSNDFILNKSINVFQFIDDDIDSISFENESENGIDLDDPENGIDLDDPENGIDLDDPENGIDLDDPENEEDLNDPENEEDLDDPENEEDLDDPENEEDLNDPENELPARVNTIEIPKIAEYNSEFEIPLNLEIIILKIRELLS